MAFRVLVYNNPTGGRDKMPNNGPDLIANLLANELESAHFETIIQSINPQQSIVDHLYNLRVSVQSACLVKEIPVVISSEHSSAIGTLSGALSAHDKPFGIVWLDAHADLHSPLTSPSGNLHGMPVAALMGLDHQNLAKNYSIPFDLNWNEIKQLSNSGHIITPDDFFYVGLRSLEKSELQVIRDLRIPNLSSKECKRVPPTLAADMVLRKFNNHDSIFISFDLDVLDPQYAPGVAVHARNGLDPEWVGTFLNALVQSHKVIGLEITEFNPKSDPNLTTIANLSIITERMLSAWKKIFPISA